VSEWLSPIKTLQANDVCVYDRGYFSYGILSEHIQAGVHPVFRMKKNAGKDIEAFINSDQTDKIITLMPDKARQKDIKKRYPRIVFNPLKLRA
jgi:hypothetical protein